MINALLLEAREQNIHLEHALQQYCPQIQICHKVKTYDCIPKATHQHAADLVFIHVKQPCLQYYTLLEQLSNNDIEYILVSDNRDLAYEALKHAAAGFVLQPITQKELLTAVNAAEKNIRNKHLVNNQKGLLSKVNKQLHRQDKIGIPTMEGLDFIQVDEIVRCEGMQKCTILYTCNQQKLVSSYNLGEFRKLLEPYGFFSPHKSHLINLHQMKKYRREGSILMTDESRVPVSRRRRAEFLASITHL
ncbi:MAG: LytTR family transcriptional regulator DNA-binding domain-containing protein [Bacteroidota bacterium]